MTEKSNPIDKDVRVKRLTVFQTFVNMAILHDLSSFDTRIHFSFPENTTFTLFINGW